MVRLVEGKGPGWACLHPTRLTSDIPNTGLRVAQTALDVVGESWLVLA